MNGKTREEHLKVDAKIVTLLSSATYENFPSALRELVSNAYDADATSVDITVNLKSNQIKVVDNGNGMSPEDFSFFLRIAGQHRGRKTSPVFARERIGQFGIGFLAVFPFGDRVTISSTVRGSDLRFEAVIPTIDYVNPKGLVDVQDIPIPVTEARDPRFKESHGVTITISPVSDLARRYFRDPPEKPLSRRLQNAIRDLPAMERLQWSLEENLPIRYPVGNASGEAFSSLPSPDLAVTLNGIALRRNAPGADTLEASEWRSGDVSCRYVIATDWKALPNEERGLKIRLHNVGVGLREQFDLQTHGKTYSHLHWITGEIRILDGFDSLITIDRAKFRESPEYDDFRDYFRGRLAHFANHLEFIIRAKRDIHEQLTESRSAKVGPKKEAIDKSIQGLKERGFTIVPIARTSKKDEQVKVDLRERIVTVSEDDSSFNDQITVDSKVYPVMYNIWNPYGEDRRAVRRSPDGIIEINKHYPLFRSKRYGEVFRRIFVILLLADEQKGDSQDFQSIISKRLEEEFSDLLS